MVQPSQQDLNQHEYAEQLIAGLEFLGRLDQHRGLAHISDDGRVLLR